MERKSESVALRQATQNDMGFLAQTFLVSLREPIHAARGSWDEARERDQFERQLQLEHTQVIAVDGEDVGVVLVIPRSDEIELHTVCVVPERQRQGIGSIVTRRIMASARAVGLPVTLYVLKTNPRAKRLYERLGFVSVGESESHFRLMSDFEGGRDLDRVI